MNFDPNDAEAYRSRGAAYSNLKDYESALKDLDRAVKFNPNDAIAFYNLRINLSGIGRRAKSD
ncbi:tetratricopeptide repeat protein [Nostoc sp.]|uniref:tetratricopeptide repeat protein n=1 Tax=Nostoc sp. TaxID=1180 RepID=UPI003FA583F7